MMGAMSFDLVIGFLLSLIGVMLLGTGFDFSILYLPVIIIPALMIGLGLAWFFSALGVFIRDIGQLGSFLGLALLYSSGVFYSAEKAEKTALKFGKFCRNPLLQIIDALRQIILWGGTPSWSLIAYAWCFGAFTLLFGAWFFNRLRPAFADVL